MSFRRLLGLETIVVLILAGMWITAAIMIGHRDYVQVVIAAFAYVMTWVLGLVTGYDRGAEAIDQETLIALEELGRDATERLAEAICRTNPHVDANINRPCYMHWKLAERAMENLTNA